MPARCKTPHASQVLVSESSRKASATSVSSATSTCRASTSQPRAVPSRRSRVSACALTPRPNKATVRTFMCCIKKAACSSPADPNPPKMASPHASGSRDVGAGTDARRSLGTSTWPRRRADGSAPSPGPRISCNNKVLANSTITLDCWKDAGSGGRSSRRSGSVGCSTFTTRSNPTSGASDTASSRAAAPLHSSAATAPRETKSTLEHLDVSRLASST